MVFCKQERFLFMAGFHLCKGISEKISRRVAGVAAGHSLGRMGGRRQGHQVSPQAADAFTARRSVGYGDQPDFSTVSRLRRGRLSPPLPAATEICHGRIFPHPASAPLCLCRCGRAQDEAPAAEYRHCGLQHGQSGHSHAGPCGGQAHGGGAKAGQSPLFPLPRHSQSSQGHLRPLPPPL